ncbi:MAG: hypothetical protein IJ067_01910 [Prevotella sp.]|nr:hypothetical protein [Prevotella sp.]
MKKYLIAIAMVLTLSMNADAAAQKHRHTPRTEQVDSTKQNHDAIEAFSDTTAVDTTYYDDEARSTNVNVSLSDEEVKGLIEDVLGNIGGKEITAVFIVLGTLFILFVLFPVIILIGVVWLINRNRREKIKLAQMAVNNGQQIPDHLFKEDKPETVDEDYSKGMRQLFLGLGLMFFLGYTAGSTGFGIGALVFCIGLGKVVIAKTSQKKDDPDRDLNNHSNNPSDIQNYE